MTSISPALAVNVWGTTRKLHFSNARDVKNWLSHEIDTWASVGFPANARVLKLRRSQDAVYQAIRGAIDSGDNSLAGLLDPIERGTVVSTDSPFFPLIQNIATVDPDAAGIAMVLSRSDASAQLAAMGLGPPFDLVARFIALAQIHGGQSGESLVKNQLEDLSRLKNSYDEAISSFRITHEKLESQVSRADESFQENKRETSKEWEKHLSSSKEDWAKLKLVYDTELGLRAPTTYWTERARSQGKYAIGYGIAFALSIAAMIAVFATWGITYISTVPREASAIIAVLPVIIPAFAGIWILRILGRLLSESLSLMRDAKERETLVKTFLALMKDESTGKSVVQEEDRILILHSLFRPSATTSVDDSPPVHWFDILASRVGQKGKD